MRQTGYFIMHYTVPDDTYSFHMVFAGVFLPAVKTAFYRICTRLIFYIIHFFSQFVKRF